MIIIIKELQEPEMIDKYKITAKSENTLNSSNC